MADGIDLYKLTVIAPEQGVPGFNLTFNSREAALKAYEALEDTFPESGEATAGAYIDLTDDYGVTVSTTRSDWKFVHLARMVEAFEGEVQVNLTKSRLDRAAAKRHAREIELENSRPNVIVPHR